MAAPAAHAATPYASIFGGASFLQKPKLAGTRVTHTTTTAFQTKASIDTAFKTGYVIGTGWGIDWGSLRTELELAGRENNSGKSAHLVTHYAAGPVAKHSFTTTLANRDATVTSDLALRAYSLMANAWFDFHDMSIGGLTPYVGGGIGGADVQLGGKLNSAKIYDKNQFTFAWQVGAGVNMPLSAHSKLFADYRYFSAHGAQLTIEPGYHGATVGVPFEASSVLVGIRLDL